MMNKPLVYYFISIFTGCLSSIIFMESYYVGAVFAASFLLVIYFYENYKYVFICFLFLISGYISFNTYYSLSLPNKVPIRVITKSGFNVLGSYQGRKIYLSGKIHKLEEGSIIYAKGTFSHEKDYLKGIVGRYIIEEYKVGHSDLISKSYKLKRKLYSSFKTMLGEENSALVMSLCFGDTEYLSKSQKIEFQNMGVIHAVSVSGFHISLIFVILQGILGLIPSILISILYVIFTGSQAAAVRALLMIIISKASKKLYSNYDPISALSFAGIVLLACKPYYVNDIGFNLSFLATLGIILYYKKISSSLFMLPQKINESLSLTLSAQLFTLPYISFTLQNFSFGFILGNILLIPIYSIVVVIGNMGLIFFSTSIFRFICIILKYIIGISNGVSTLLLKVSPETIFIGGDIGISLLLIYFSYILYIHGYRKWRWFPGFLAVFFALKCYAIIPQIKYIETQHAECMYIRYKFRSVLICKYDITNGYELQNILKGNAVDKVITNIKSKATIKVYDNLYVNTLDDDGIVLQLLYGNKKIILPVKFKNMSINSESELKYGIMEPKLREWYVVSGKLFEAQ